MDADEAVAVILNSLIKNDALRRKHANFWNFAKKSSKELGIFSEIFERLEADYGSKISSWRLCENDPPDIEVDLGGKRIGLEITELVKESAIEAQIKNSDQYPHELLKFGFTETQMQLQKIVAKKERKVTPIREDSEDLVLLVHTDEPMISSDLFETYQWPHTSIFERIYLLFSYEPAKGQSPLIRLK